jgi:hypothetical protein
MSGTGTGIALRESTPHTATPPGILITTTMTTTGIVTPPTAADPNP